MADAARQEPQLPLPEAVDDERLQKATAYIEEEEGATSRYRGVLGLVIVLLVFLLPGGLLRLPARLGRIRFARAAP